MTLGEYRVGIHFNPGGDPLVSDIKRVAADLIDLVAKIPTWADEDQCAEIARCKALAMTQAEDAAMWAVKAATKPAP